MCSLAFCIAVPFLAPRGFGGFGGLFGLVTLYAFSYRRASRMARSVDLFDDAAAEGWLQAVARETSGQFFAGSSAPVVLTVAGGRVTLTGRTVEDWPAGSIGLGGPPSHWSTGMKLMTPSGIRYLSFVAASDLGGPARVVVDRRAYTAVQRALLANQSSPLTDAL